MNIQIYGKSKCFDTKKAERWFKERRIKYQYVDLPRYGLGAYVGGFYVTETANLILSLLCLFTAVPASPAGAARRSPARPEQTG